MGRGATRKERGKAGAGVKNLSNKTLLLPCCVYSLIGLNVGGIVKNM